MEYKKDCDEIMKRDVKRIGEGAHSRKEDGLSKYFRGLKVIFAIFTHCNFAYVLGHKYEKFDMMKLNC
jgi:hypothetical protein